MMFLTNTMFTCLKNNSMSIYNRDVLKNSGWRENYPYLFNNKVKKSFLRNGFVSSQTTMPSAANNLNMERGVC